MKTLDEFIKEINDSKELQEELKNTRDVDAANAFLKKHDCAATADELAEYIRSQKNDGQGELSDDEVSEVAGGFWMDIGAGWFWVDETLPQRPKKTEPVLESFKIEILEE